MRISKFQIENYKSFEDSGEVALSSGVNVVIGQNNVGKTALLESLGLRFSAKPHKSLNSIPRHGSPINPTSTARVTLTARVDEVREILLGGGVFFVPIPVQRAAEEPDQLANVLSQVLTKHSIDIPLYVSSTGPQNISILPQDPGLGSYEVKRKSGGILSHAYAVSEDKTSFIPGGVVYTDEQTIFGVEVAKHLMHRIYTFKAERLNLGSHAMSANSVLSADARNLPDVLHHLQTNNPERFEVFNDMVRKIFPSIYRVSARPKVTGGGEVEVVVWTEDPKSQRSDLAIELTESGTGVGQVLAMLYAVLNSDFPRTIIIDEPNSFLHPGASRKLIQVLLEFQEHQFIISTHSPEIIAASEPKTLIFIKWQKPKSVLEALDAKEVDSVRRSLVEVGARLSDVYGADRVLWVEGQTEEECFKLILSRLARVHPVGTVVVAVRNTGDFQRGRSSVNAIIDIYVSLSAGNALIPSAVAFIFDREARSDRDIEDIERRSRDLVHFLPRRTYENYLLDRDALAAMFSTMPGLQEIPDLPARVADWIEQNGEKKKYFAPGEITPQVHSEGWIKEVNAPRLLSDMTQELSNSTEEYRKTTHSVWMTDWLIENKPDFLAELRDLLVCLLQQPE